MDFPSQVLVCETVKEMQQRRLSVKYSLEEQNEILVLIHTTKYSYEGEDHLFRDSSTVSKRMAMEQSI